jgi:hypothetical protein
VRRAGLIFAVLAVVLALPSAASAQISVFNAKPVSGMEGKDLGNPRVVTFQDTGACAASAYAVTVDWGAGDGTSAGSVAKAVQPSPGQCQYDAQADHTYARSGAFTYTVTVCKGATCAAPVTATATIAEAPLKGEAKAFNATATQSFSGQVAEFKDDNELSQQGDFTASINWGDGTAASPGVISGSGGNFTVNGTHTYASAGSFSVVVTLVHNNSNFVLDPTSVTVGAAPQTGGGGGGPINPASPATLRIVGARTARSIRNSGLGVRLRNVPSSLKSVTLQLFRGSTRIARQVVGVPRHKNLASVTVRWRLSKKVVAKLRTGRAYGVSVRDRAGKVPSLAARFTLRR